METWAVASDFSAIEEHKYKEVATVLNRLASFLVTGARTGGAGAADANGGYLDGAHGGGADAYGDGGAWGGEISMIERERREYGVNALHQNICFTYGLHDILMSTFEMQRVVAASGDEFFEVGRRPNGSPTRVVRRLRALAVEATRAIAYAPPHCHLDRATSRPLAELRRRR